MYERFISSSMFTGICSGTKSAIFGDYRRDAGLEIRDSWRRGFRPNITSDLDGLYVARSGLDELPPRLDLISHQRGEHQVRFGVILGPNLEQRPHLRIHRRRPQSIGIHFAEALVPVDGD